MKIGVIGSEGVVGKACCEGFSLIGHEVLRHDLLLNTNIYGLLKSDVIFITVPTPQLKDGSCDTSIVEGVISELKDSSYKGIIAIKSTVEPGTTKKLSKKYGINLNFVPEFLKERSANEDFINHGTLIIGSADEESSEIIKASHLNLPDNVIVMKPTEAEMVKYFHNVFNALRIVFANEIYEICKFESISYDVVLDGCIHRNDYTSDYLEVNEDLRGYAGVCLPKDTLALASYVKKNHLNLDIFKAIHEENEKLKKTVFKNMRKK